MDDVTRVFKRNYVSRGNGDVMLYADDIALWSDRKEDIGDALELWNRVLTEAGLYMNAEKTETMIVSRNREELVVEVDG